MTQTDIIALPNPLLRQKSRRIGQIDAEVKQLVDHMTEATLDWEDHREHEAAAALAAVQIGQLYRVIIIRNDFDNREDRSFSALINPEIVKTEGVPSEELEGCLSVTSLYGKVARFPKVKVKALNLEGKQVRLTATGFLARVLQHEIDHTQGQLFVDRINDPTKLFRLEKDGQFTAAGPTL